MDTFHTKLNSQTKINLALSYENEDIIIKFSNEYDVEIDLAKKYFEEVKKFLFLCATESKILAPSAEIDKIWHTFILFTKDYRLYCINFLGKFIDHVPEVNKPETPPEENYLQNTLDCYKEVFGELNNEVWQVSIKEDEYKNQCSEYSSCSECSSCESRGSQPSCVFTGNCYDCQNSGYSCVGENPNNL